MKIAIDQIKVNDEIRIRKEIGDLQTLVESITKVGLLNPILIDEQSNLIAGYRRLQACKLLKMEEVEVKIVEFGGDAMKKLDVEIAENFYRKDFTPQEVLASEFRRQEIIESTRKKGIFERFWQWLRSLFSAKQPPIQTERGRAESTIEKTTGERVSVKQKEQRETETTAAVSPESPEQVKEREKTGNLASSQDDYSIKWRDK